MPSDRHKRTVEKVDGTLTRETRRKSRSRSPRVKVYYDDGGQSKATDKDKTRHQSPPVQVEARQRHSSRDRDRDRHTDRHTQRTLNDRFGKEEEQLNERLNSYRQKYQQRIGPPAYEERAFGSNRTSTFGRGSYQRGNRAVNRFVPVHEELRTAEKDGREVIRLIDPTEVPKGRSYFEHDDRRGDDFDGGGRGGGRRFGFRGGRGGFRGGYPHNPFHDGDRSGRFNRDRRRRTPSPVWSHDMFGADSEAKQE